MGLMDRFYDLIDKIKKEYKEIKEDYPELYDIKRMNNHFDIIIKVMEMYAFENFFIESFTFYNLRIANKLSELITKENEVKIDVLYLKLKEITKMIEENYKELCNQYKNKVKRDEKTKFMNILKYL